MLKDPVLVTGAGRGIGRHLAVGLAALGHPVGITSRSAEALKETAALVELAGVPAVAVVGDVTVPEDVEHACATVEQALGPIGVLVNNAGTSNEFDSPTMADPAVWWRVIEVNVRGPALFSRRLVPPMVSRGRGRVVNIVSSAAFWRDADGTASSYAVSKAALMRLTSALAAELAGTGVTVFDVSPGLVRTAMTERLPNYDQLPEQAFSPADAVVHTVGTLISGGYEALHGRFIHVRDDLEELRERAAAEPRARTLGLRPLGPDDPLATV